MVLKYLSHPAISFCALLRYNTDNPGGSTNRIKGIKGVGKIHGKRKIRGYFPRAHDRVRR